MTSSLATCLLVLGDLQADLAQASGSCHLGALDVTVRAHARDAGAACEATRFDAVIVSLEDARAAEAAVRSLRARHLDAPIIVCAKREGHARLADLPPGAAQDLLPHDYESGALVRAVLLAVERWRSFRQQRQLLSLFTAAPDAMIVTDAQGQVRYANRAACVLFGREEASFVGARVSFGRNFAGIDIFAKVAGAGDVRIMQCAWEGKPAFLAIIRDVAEQEALASQLSAAQRTDAIGQYAAGVAHDLGNVLSCIDLFAGFARRRLGHDNAGDGDLAKILHAVETGRDLTRQMVSLARGSAEAPRLLDLGEVVTGLQPFLRRALPAQIDLQCACAGALWPVWAERGKIEQVILNLALNARDAMPNGGVLRIETENLYVLDDDAPSFSSERVALRVIDTGAGVAAEHLSRIFEPFYTTKHEAGGSGLGLAMCRRSIAQAGGDISVDSRPGEGATFSILLPKAVQSAPCAVPATVAISDAA
jgi:two-component system, cell cycle sensor histidine kinase and response regulator CckA